MHAPPAEVKQDKALPSCFSSHTIKKRPYGGIYNATFFCICGPFVALAVENGPEHRAEVLSSAPKHKRL